MNKVPVCHSQYERMSCRVLLSLRAVSKWNMLSSPNAHPSRLFKLYRNCNGDNERTGARQGWARLHLGFPLSPCLTW